MNRNLQTEIENFLEIIQLLMNCQLKNFIYNCLRYV